MKVDANITLEKEVYLELMNVNAKFTKLLEKHHGYAIIFLLDIRERNIMKHKLT